MIIQYGCEEIATIKYQKTKQNKKKHSSSKQTSYNFSVKS